MQAAVAFLLLVVAPLLFPAPGAHGAAARPDTQGAPPRDTTTPTDPGTAVIRGRVIAADSGQPLRRAIVRLGGERLRGGNVTLTDERGRYEFRDVPAGRFVVTASKTGYTSSPYTRRIRQVAGSVQVREGQVLEGVEITLLKGGAIVGRITDEIGEPLANVTVMVLRRTYIDGRQRLVPAGPDGGPGRTDDLGHFRIYGLPPADYYVSAQAQDPFNTFSQSELRVGFAITYYPGTAAPSEALRLRIAPGAEASASFALVPARLVAVSGTVIDSTGRPLERGFVALQHGVEAGGIFSRGGPQLGADGSFHMGDMAPGEYVLHVSSVEDGSDGDDDFEAAAVPLSIGTEDITGLTIVTSRNATISGLVVTDTGTPVTGRPDFSLTSRSPSVSLRGGRVRVSEDLAFEARVPAETLTFIRGGGLPGGWLLSAVLHDGVDVIDSGFSLLPGERAGGVQLVLSRTHPRLVGTIVDGRGRAVSDCVVFVFPEDERLRTTGRHVGMTRADEQGRFELNRLPPAAYLGVALDTMPEPGRAEDPEYLDELQRHATRFRLVADQETTVTLRLLARE